MAYKKHGGLSRHPLARAYKHMVERCTKSSVRSFKSYGGRGITVCDRWLSGDGDRSGLACFIADMGEKPTPFHTIERIDVNGNYDPGNVTWALPERQCRNKRNSIKVPIDGTLVPLIDVCEQRGIPYKRAYFRYRKGWPLDAILNEPVVRGLPLGHWLRP